jgi:energy-coupling factor transport system ATP-binding protein
MSEAALAQRVIAMSDGRIVADGTPKEVFTQVELLRSVGLTVPETTQLIYELDREGCGLPLDALSVEECAQALRRYLAEV